MYLGVPKQSTFLKLKSLNRETRNSVALLENKYCCNRDKQDHFNSERLIFSMAPKYSARLYPGVYVVNSQP